MWFKHKAWIPIAWLISLGNLGAVWFAALPAEPTHATVHALLAVLFALGAQRLTTRRAASVEAQPVVADERLQHFEHAIDSIAVELERIGEGQRFVTKLLAGRERDPDRSARSEPDPAAAARRSPPDDES